MTEENKSLVAPPQHRISWFVSILDHQLLRVVNVLMGIYCFLALLFRTKPDRCKQKRNTFIKVY
jgi:hypothetical protein